MLQDSRLERETQPSRRNPVHPAFLRRQKKGEGGERGNGLRERKRPYLTRRGRSLVDPRREWGRETVKRLHTYCHTDSRMLLNRLFQSSDLQDTKDRVRARALRKAADSRTNRMRASMQGAACSRETIKSVACESSNCSIQAKHKLAKSKRKKKKLSESFYAL